jgi:hypothetical protein
MRNNILHFQDFLSVSTFLKKKKGKEHVNFVS